MQASTDPKLAGPAPTLEDILKAVDDIKPLPEPFNGATRLIVSRELLEAVSPHLAHCFAPHLMPSIEVRPALPPGYGVGYRPWRDGDDPEVKFMDEVVVWFCGPKADENRG